MRSGPCHLAESFNVERSGVGRESVRATHFEGGKGGGAPQGDPSARNRATDDGISYEEISAVHSIDLWDGRTEGQRAKIRKTELTIRCRWDRHSLLSARPGGGFDTRRSVRVMGLRRGDLACRGMLVLVCLPLARNRFPIVHFFESFLFSVVIFSGSGLILFSVDLVDSLFLDCLYASVGLVPVPSIQVICFTSWLVIVRST